jgi:hypothetical protein
MTTSLRWMVRVALCFCLLAGCGDDDSATDVPHDGDADADTPTDTPADTTPPPAYSTCLRSCTSPDDCCVATGAICGDYSNRWTCDGTCRVGSCADDAECAAWADWLGLPGAADYQCKPGRLYYSASYCVPGCTAAADCCPAGTDCSTYPQRRACNAGACEVMGCENDTECQTWATAEGAPNPANWICRTPAFKDTGVCTVACTTTDDCCPGGCAAYPNRLACSGGYCVSACLDDTECRDWATAGGAPRADAYTCASFTY